MAALYIVELLVAAAFMYLVFAQLVIPLWRNTPLLPFLEKERALRHDLRDAKQGVVEQELKLDIKDSNRHRKQMKEKKGSTK